MIKHSYEEKYKNILFSKINNVFTNFIRKKQSHYIKNVMRLDEEIFYHFLTKMMENIIVRL